MKRLLLVSLILLAICTDSFAGPPGAPFSLTTPGAIGNVLTSNGTIWTSAAATGGSTSLATSISDGDITHAPDGNSVFDALAGKGNYHGIQAIGTIAFDPAAHSLSVASITYWYQGIVRVSATPITCDLDLTADRDHASASLTTNTLYYFYFKDATGKLYWSPVFWNLNTMVPVATVFWNGIAGAISKESHSYTRDIDWHIWTHLTVGARYGSGLDKTYPTTSVDGSLQIETGTIYDEDLVVTTGQQTTMRAYYKTNSTTWTFGDFSLPYTGALGASTYLDTDTYTLTTYANNKYACYWVFATTDVDKPIAVIPTHATDPYSQVSVARSELQPAVAGINPEWKLIYRFIFAGDGQFQESSDYRLQTSLAGAVSAATTAGSVSFAPSGSVAATTVQTAIEEIDSEKAPLSGAALTSATINALTPTALATGFTIAGGATSKTLTVPLDASVSGTNTGDATAVEIDAHTAQSPSAAQLASCNATTIHNYAQDADSNVTLPTAAANIGGMVTVSTTVAKYFRFTLAGKVYLNGSMTPHDYVQYTSCVAGNYASFFTMKLADGTYGYFFTDGVGSLTAG